MEMEISSSGSHLAKPSQPELALAIAARALACDVAVDSIEGRNKDDAVNSNSDTQFLLRKTPPNHTEAFRLGSVDQGARVTRVGKGLSYIVGMRNDNALLALDASSGLIDAGNGAAVMMLSNCRPGSAADLEDGVLRLGP